MTKWAGARSYDVTLDCLRQIEPVVEGAIIDRYGHREVAEMEAKWYRQLAGAVDEAHVIAIGEEQSDALPAVPSDTVRQWAPALRPPFKLTFVSMEYSVFPRPPCVYGLGVLILGGIKDAEGGVSVTTGDRDIDTVFWPMVRFIPPRDRMREGSDAFTVFAPLIRGLDRDGRWWQSNAPVWDLMKEVQAEREARGIKPELVTDQNNEPGWMTDFSEQCANGMIERTLSVLWFLEAANVELAPKPLPRPQRRQAERSEKRIVDHVTVRRKRIRRAGSGEGRSGAKRDYTHQWQVRGFYRHVTRGKHTWCLRCRGSTWDPDLDEQRRPQKCISCDGTGESQYLTFCPEHGRCRREWVDEHVAGPEDKPFIPKPIVIRP